MSPPLRSKLVRKGRLAVGVVGGIELDPVGGGVGADAEDHRPRLALLDLAEDQVGAAEQRVDGLALRILDRGRQRVEARKSIDGRSTTSSGPATVSP